MNEQVCLAQAKIVRLIGAAGAGGSVKGQVGRVESPQIGSTQLSQVLTVFTEDTAGAFADPTLAGNIGMQIARASRFSRLRTEPHHPRAVVHASRSIRCASPGMAVRTEGDYHTFRVKDVLEKSPASKPVSKRRRHRGRQRHAGGATDAEAG